MRLTTEPYKTLISTALEARGSQMDDFLMHPVHHYANYVVRICEQIRESIGRRGGLATLEAVMRLERCVSGHVDHHTKLALYFAELEVGASALA